MTVGVPREIYPEEKRVAISPEATQRLVKQGFKVVIEKGAGKFANFSDEKFKEAGATLVSASEVYSTSDIVLKVRPPQENHPELKKHELDAMKKGATFISFI